MVRAAAIGLVLAGAANVQTVPPAGRRRRGARADVCGSSGSGRCVGAIALRAGEGVILLHAVVLGQPATVLLDNGTDRTVIDTGFAQRAGIAIRASRLGAIAGQSRLPIQLADGVTLTLPHTLTAQDGMPAFDLGPMSAALGRPIAAVIGGDLLLRLAVMVRPGKRQVSIVQSGGITPGTVAVVMRRPATNVVVWRWPCGWPIRSRSPRRQRLWLRVMLVAVQVSSMNTSRSGSGSSCLSNRSAPGFAEAPTYEQEHPG